MYLVRYQATFLAALACSHKGRIMAAGARRLHKLWRAKPSLVEEYVSCVLPTGPYLCALTLFGVITEYCQKRDKLEKSQQVLCQCSSMEMQSDYSTVYRSTLVNCDSVLCRKPC